MEEEGSVETVYLCDRDSEESVALWNERGPGLFSIAVSIPYLKPIPPDDADEEDQELMEVLYRPLRDQCLHCEGPLADATTFVLVNSGIIAAFCSSACLQDSSTTGWLYEQLGDLQDKAAMRGGRGDELEEE